MSKLRILVMVCLAACLARPALAGSAVGMVDDCKGSVQRIQNGRKAPVRLGDQVYANDRLVVAHGASVVVAFYANQLREAASAGTYSVARTGLMGHGVRKLPPEAGGPVLRGSRASLAEYVPGASVSRGEDGLTLLYPPHAIQPRIGPPVVLYVPSLRPHLRWSFAHQPVKVEVDLFARGKDGNLTKLWSRVATAADLSYPSDEKPLVHGQQYDIRIAAVDDDDPSQSDEAVFTVANAKQAAAIGAAERAFKTQTAANARDVAAYTRLARVYLEHGALADAAQLMETLETMDPNDPGVHLWLRRYYTWIQLHVKAAQEEAALKKLGVTEN